MKLKLNGIDVDCIIGDLPDERLRTQTLRVAVELELPDAVAHSDELADTVDYAALSAKIRAVLIEAQCRLIERAAKLVAEACFKDARVTSVRASVTKAGAVLHLESAEAIYELRR